MHLNKLSYELYIHPCGDVKCVGDICWTNRPMPVLLTEKTCLRLPSLILLRFLLPVPNSDCERVPRVMRSFYRLAPSGLIGCLVSTWVPVSQKCGRLSRYWFWSTPGTPSASCSDRCKTSRWSLINLSISQTFCLVTIKTSKLKQADCLAICTMSWVGGVAAGTTNFRCRCVAIQAYSDQFQSCMKTCLDFCFANHMYTHVYEQMLGRKAVLNLALRDTGSDQDVHILWTRKTWSILKATCSWVQSWNWN